MCRLKKKKHGSGSQYFHSTAFFRYNTSEKFWRFSVWIPPHSFPAAQCLVVHFIWISMINRQQRLQALIKELLLEEAKRTTRIIRNKCLEDHPSRCKWLITMVIAFPSYQKRNWLLWLIQYLLLQARLALPSLQQFCMPGTPAKKGKCTGMFSGI